MQAPTILIYLPQTYSSVLPCRTAASLSGLAQLFPEPVWMSWLIIVYMQHKMTIANGVEFYYGGICMANFRQHGVLSIDPGLKCTACRHPRKPSVTADTTVANARLLLYVVRVHLRNGTRGTVRCNASHRRYSLLHHARCIISNILKTMRNGICRHPRQDNLRGVARPTRPRVHTFARPCCRQKHCQRSVGVLFNTRISPMGTRIKHKGRGLL